MVKQASSCLLLLFIRREEFQVKNTVMILSGITVLAAVILIIVTNQKQDDPNQELHIAQFGMKAPSFSLETIDGKSVNSNDYLGKAVLLSFLYVHSSKEFNHPDAQATRAQIPFIKSMSEQYGPRGLEVLIADSTNQIYKKSVSDSERINFYHDIGLSGVPFLMDNAKDAAAKKFGVRLLPTTFLIDPNGDIAGRWDNKATPAQLALAIEEILGPPHYRNRSTDMGDKNTPDDKVTPAQSKFAGIPPVRQLSDHIWVSDGGNTKAGKPTGLTWVVLSNETSARLEGTALHDGSGNTGVVVSDALEPLPPDEAKNILTNLPGETKNVNLVTTTVTFTEPGYYTLKAQIVLPSGEVAEKGQCIIQVE